MVFTQSPFISDVVQIRQQSSLSDREIISHTIHPLDASADFLQNDDYYSWYYSVARCLSPQIIGEIGVRFGYSLNAMIRGTASTPESVQVYGFDNESYVFGSMAHAEAGLRRCGVEQIELHKLDSQSVESLPLAGKVDLFHVDGDHTEAGAYHDLQLALKVTRPGGAILLDDVTCIPEVKMAGDRFTEEQGLECHFLPSLRGLYVIRLKEQSYPPLH